MYEVLANLEDPFRDNITVVGKPAPKAQKSRDAQPVADVAYTPNVYDVPEPTQGSVYAVWAIQQLLHDTLSSVIEVSFFDSVQLGDYAKIWDFFRTVRISLQREAASNPRRARLCNQLINVTGVVYRQGMDTESLGVLYGVLIDEPRAYVARQELKTLVFDSIPALEEKAADLGEDLFYSRAKFDQAHAEFVEGLNKKLAKRN